MHWILILTIISSAGVHIESVGPFFKEGHCNKAANAWLLAVDKKEMGNATFKASALCVKK